MKRFAVVYFAVSADIIASIVNFMGCEMISGNLKCKTFSFYCAILNFSLFFLEIRILTLRDAVL